MPNLPLLMPVLGTGVLMGWLASRRVSGWLACPRWAAVVLVVALTGIAAVTLTPQDVESSGSPMWPFSWLLDWLGERILNVLLFVPLGVAVILVGKRHLRWVLVAAALVLPMTVEGIQHVVSPLTRDAQWQDVFDNTLGVVIGMMLGLALRRWPHWDIAREEL